MTLELFRCVPLGVKLTRSSCGDRHQRAGREMRHEGKQGAAHLVGAQRCATCPVGAAHSRGEKPDAWDDGAPLELVDAPTVPEPGRSKWTGSGEVPSSPPAPPARSTILPPPPPTSEGTKTMPRPAKKHTYNGKTLTAYAWADEPEAKATGIGRQALCERLRAGWTIYDALTVGIGQRRERVVKPDVMIGAELEKMVRPSKPKPRPAKASPAPKSKGTPASPGLSVGLSIALYAGGVPVARGPLSPERWAQLVAELLAGGEAA